jgi:hypothetical protein
MPEEDRMIRHPWPAPGWAYVRRDYLPGEPVYYLEPVTPEMERYVLIFERRN